MSVLRVGEQNRTSGMSAPDRTSDRSGALRPRGDLSGLSVDADVPPRFLGAEDTASQYRKTYTPGASQYQMESVFIYVADCNQSQMWVVRSGMVHRRDPVWAFV